MTTEEKAAAFDLLAVALTNRWHDGWWTWWCSTPCGGAKRATREEAVADLVEWARFTAARRAKHMVAHDPLRPAKCGDGPAEGAPAARPADDAAGAPSP